MTNEQTISCISNVGADCVHSLTILAAHIDKMGRDTDADLISGAARDVAGVVLSLIEQFAEDPASFTN
jgi:hypothetical protein